MKSVVDALIGIFIIVAIIAMGIVSGNAIFFLWILKIASEQ